MARTLDIDNGTVVQNKATCPRCGVQLLREDIDDHLEECDG